VAADAAGERSSAGTKSGAFRGALLAELPRLRRYALALIGEAALADDLLQDTVERALRNEASLMDVRQIYSWLRSILHNLYIDEVRQRRSRPSQDVDESADSLALSVPAADRGLFVDLTRAMADLTLDHRQILLLAGLEGLSYREMADELGIPIGTVMSRLVRAREQLRRRLEADAAPAKMREAT
jgi:RNA polymerase sigma-70 factor, ECF subfamily